MQSIKDYMLEQLKNLISIDSPSGYTEKAQQYLVDELTRLGYQPKRLNKGGVTVHLGGEGNPIMLFAHVDTLGAVVHHIKPNGRLALTNVGGLNPNNTETETVKIITRFDGVYDGTIQVPNASTHVNSHVNDARSFADNLEVVIDEDVRSAEDVKKLGIMPGDFIAVCPRFTVTPSGYIKSRFLDDKASASVLLAYAKMLKDENITPKRSIYLDFTVYEEIGHGAACGIPEDVVECIAVDMGCVGENVTCTEKQVSICAKDSSGPYNYELTSALVKTARENNIDYAVDVYNFYSSDVSVSLRAGYDVRHALIGPGVYASHGYERSHIEGLWNTFALLRAYLA
ncbi:MAG TPA: M42 family metallopeptidase [Candidatus Ventrousia excrementavium]|uniref:M42 family metallopeptidase n=1 Tax=Candidatus Ventrousia excrementavium TaxID=2840961 RepID=A0A9D1IWY6_9CLOT|nr:M42 family metallopeptidase [Candidatus Ventrousia excrementavium]